MKCGKTVGDDNDHSKFMPYDEFEIKIFFMVIVHMTGSTTDD